MVLGTITIYYNKYRPAKVQLIESVHTSDMHIRQLLSRSCTACLACSYSLRAVF